MGIRRLALALVTVAAAAVDAVVVGPVVGPGPAGMRARVEAAAAQPAARRQGKGPQAQEAQGLGQGVKGLASRTSWLVTTARLT